MLNTDMLQLNRIEPENKMMKSIKQIMRRLVSAGGADGFLQQNLSTFGYLCVCLNAIFFGYILVTEPIIRNSIFFDLTKEDSYVENLTAILFFLAGFLLVIVATTERRIFPRCIYILGCVAFIFVAGEEISWGQRIFGFDTPENLMNINTNNEFNIHNIKTEGYSFLSVLERISQYGTFVFCIITFVAFSCNKKTIFGIPLPSIPLMLSFLVMLSIPLYTYTYIMRKELLLIFIIYTLLSKQISLMMYATATMILITVVPYTYRHDDGIIYSVEIQEFLLGLCCFFYSLELLYAQRSANLFAVKDSLKTMFSHIPWICVMYGSIYLVFLKLSQPEMILRDQQEAIRLFKEVKNKADPIIRSNYDVYLKEKSLMYVKDNCSSEDMNMLFFLHIYPIQQSDLPYSRKQFGFDNLDFYSYEVGELYDQRCIVVRRLPSYDIAKITTGQFIVNRRNGKLTYPPIWNGTYMLTREAIEPNGEWIAGVVERAEPVIRAGGFDVYHDGNRLLYTGAECGEEDLAPPFFLHVYPEDEGDLPAGYREHGFHSLDFRFETRRLPLDLHFKDAPAPGGVKCIAVVDLPGYDVAHIRTGQYVPGEAWLWHGEFEVVRKAPSN